MFKTALGSFLFFLPFSSLFFLKEKKKHLLFLIFFIISFYSLASVFLQSLKIFYYDIFLILTLAFDSLFFFLFFKRKREIIFPRLKEVFFFSLVILVSFSSLWQVHYRYTGKINFVTDIEPRYHEVKNFRYPYPYFSDEWYAILLVNYSLKNHSLPFYDSLNQTPFLNFEFLFHSFLSGLMLLFNLDPLLSFVPFSIFFNILIVLLIYLFLRLNNFSSLSSSLFSLFALYLTSGANLPGLWHLLPIHFGIIFFLLTLCFLTLKDFLKSFLSIIFSFLFYPPLFPFCLLFILSLFFQNLSFFKEKFFSKKFLSFFLIFFLILVFFFLFLSQEWKEIIFSKIFFQSSYGLNFKPDINPFYIIPFPVILFLILGLFDVFQKNKTLFFIFLLGALFWSFYSFSSQRFFIEYERIVFFVSILSFLISAFGWQKIKIYLEKKIKKGKKIIILCEVFILFLILLITPFYTQREDWKTITVTNKITKKKLFPKAPANEYLTDDDLRIFQGIKNKRILTLPWKGTVLAVASENDPLIVKEGTMAKGQPKILDDFLRANCQQKKEMIKKMKIDYLYLDQDFSCLGIKKIARSKEGLILYKSEIKNE
ncbi:MAG: hypothetical protein ACPLZH_01065 [Minisyncoccales bacterium]